MDTKRKNEDVTKGNVDMEKSIKCIFCCCVLSWEVVHSNFIQLYGVFVLVFTLMKRRWFMYLAYLLIPLIGFTYVYIMDHLTQEYLKPNLDETLRRDSPFGSPHEVELRAFTLPEIQFYLVSKNVESVNHIPTKIMYTSIGDDDDTKPTEEEIYDHFFRFYGVFDMGYEIVFPNFNNTKRNGMELIQPMKENEETLDDEFYRSLKAEEFDESQPNEYIGSFSMKELSSDTLSFSVEYEQVMDRKSPSVTIQSSILSLKNNYSTFSDFCSTVGVYGHTFECENFLSSTLIHFVNSAYILRESGTVVKSRVGQIPYHSLGFDFNFNRGDRRLIFFLPMMLLTVLSLFIYSIISDKENGSRSLMDLMGLRLHNYLIGKYCLFIFYYFIFAGVSYFYGLVILKSRIFTHVDFFLLWVTLIGGGLMTISFAFFFTSFFQTNLKALVPSHLVEYVLPGFFSVIHFQVVTKGTWYWKFLSLVYPWPLVDSLMILFEPVGMKKITIHFDHLWKDKDFGFAVFSLYFMAVVFFVLFLYLEKVLPQNYSVRKHPCFCCGPIRRFFRFCCCRYLCVRKSFYLYLTTSKSSKKYDDSKKRNDINNKNLSDDDTFDDLYYHSSSSSDTENNDDVVLPNMEKDDDVERIEQEILSVKNPFEYGILVRNLKKKYSKNAPKYAVNGISFLVPHHSLYGLLGENGAGKTTTIRILIGELSSTNGECYVNGKNTKTQLSQIRKSVGVCHQHNVLWDEMTVEEHLFFYARVRGIDLILQKNHVNRILNETELIDWTSNPGYFSSNNKKKQKHSREKSEGEKTSNRRRFRFNFHNFVNYFLCCWCIFPFLQYFLKPSRKVRDLSAGTKRKLCLAISMVGNPSTLFLDEPTTGLDPKTQHHIWKIILHQKQSKSIILTTHEMLEAEVLCDEIGIMKNGEFVASGTSLHLKNKFGEGYRLKIIRKSDDEMVNISNIFDENGEILSSKEKIIRFMYSLTSDTNSSSSFQNFRGSTHDNSNNNEDNNNTTIRRRLILDFGNTLIWEIYFPESFLLSHFFEEIERRKEEIGIKDWSLNQCNLNDVFVKLIGKDRQGRAGQQQQGNEEMEDLVQQNQELQIEIQNLRDYISSVNEQEKVEDDSNTCNSSSNDRKSTNKKNEEVISVTENGNNKSNRNNFLSTSIRSFYDEKTKKEEEYLKKKRRKIDELDIFERNFFIVFFTQLYVLVKKEVLLSYRRPLWTFLTLGFASIVVFEIWITFMTGKIVDKKEYFEDLPFDTLLNQKECVTWNGENGNKHDCYHMIYTINGHPFGQKIIDYFIETVEDEFEKVERLSVRKFEDTESLLSWAIDNPNKTYHGILIEFQSSLTIPPNPLPYPYVEYTILHNATSFDGPSNDLPLSMTGYLQVVMDEAILYATTDRKYNLNGNIRRRAAPKYPLKEKHNLYDIFQQIGPCLYAVAFCFIVTESAHRFVAMKEIGLHHHLIRSGVIRFALYCSYACYFALVAIVNGVLTYIVSVLLEIDVIRKTNIVISLSLLILYSFALLSTISITFPFLKSEKNAQAVNTIFMLLVFFTSFLFDASVLYSVYEAASGFWGKLILYFILPVLFAPINFCKIYADFSYKSIPLFDYQTKEYRPNDGFGFGDILSTNRFDELSLETGPTIYWFLYLIVNIFLYIFLGWVVYWCVESRFYSFEFLWKWLCLWDHNEAIKKNQSLLSLLKKKKKKNKNDYENNNIFEIDDNNSNDKEENNNNTSIHEVDIDKFSVYLENLSKSYISMFPAFRIHPVLKNMCLATPKNQLLGILGPNASGKSTLVNLISGTLKITDGEIFVNSDKRRKRKRRRRKKKRKKNNILRVKKNMSSIRKLLGIVPQNDILIENLRAKEMLELFGICKRVKLKHLKKKITKLLTEVGLSNAMGEFVGNFSGGMKRKMSIAMSLIGSPSLILLDEPTTGIDVYSCYQIWQLFYEMKKYHSIILTSHKMSETELLSDKIAILNEQKFQVHSEPLKLKEKYGTGYLLQIVLCHESDRCKMDQLIQKVLDEFYNNNNNHQEICSIVEDSEEEEDSEPEEEEGKRNIENFPMVSQNGCNVSYSVEDKLLLSRILKEVEKIKMKEKGKYSKSSTTEVIISIDDDEEEEEEREKFIESFGISQCTLESIYMKVTLNEKE